MDTIRTTVRYATIRSIVVAAALIGSLTVGCSASEEAPVEASAVQVEDVKYSQLPGGARILTGTVYNPTAHTIKNAQVQVSLFDENNRRVSSMNVMVTDIPAGERKAFRQPVDSEFDVRRARVRSVLVM